MGKNSNNTRSILVYTSDTANSKQVEKILKEKLTRAGFNLKDDLDSDVDFSDLDDDED